MLFIAFKNAVLIILIILIIHFLIKNQLNKKGDHNSNVLIFQNNVEDEMKNEIENDEEELFKFLNDSSVQMEHVDKTIFKEEFGTIGDFSHFASPL